jgi:hypothetical protein
VLGLDSFLAAYHSGRHFLRGMHSPRPNSDHEIGFVDVVPLIRQIVAKSYDLYIMPQMAPTPPKIGSLFTCASIMRNKNIFEPFPL